MSTFFRPTPRFDPILGVTTLTLLVLLGQTRPEAREERQAFYDFKRPRRKKPTKHRRNTAFSTNTKKA